MKRHVFGATFVLFLVLLACKSRSSMHSTTTTTTTTTAEPVPASTADKDEATVKKKMATIDTIAATKLPPVTTKPTVTKKGPKPIIEGAGVNAAAVDIGAIPPSLDKKMMSFEPLALPFCGAWASGKKESIDSMYVTTCRDLKYLVVIRFSSRVDPKMVTSTTFRGGEARGDATVFDLDTGEKLGAVPFAAQNYGQLEAMQGVELGRAIADLEGQCAHVVQTALDTAWGEDKAQP